MQKNKVHVLKLYLAKLGSNKANYSTHKTTQIHYISEFFIANYRIEVQILIKIIKPTPFKAWKLFATRANGSFFVFFKAPIVSLL